MTTAPRRVELRDETSVSGLLGMGSTAEVVDNSSSEMARPVALRDAADHHRHVMRVCARVREYVGGFVCWASCNPAGLSSKIMEPFSVVGTASSMLYAAAAAAAPYLLQYH